MLMNNFLSNMMIAMLELTVVIVVAATKSHCGEDLSVR